MQNYMKMKEQSRLFNSHVEDNLSTQDTNFQFSFITHFTFMAQLFCKEHFAYQDTVFCTKNRKYPRGRSIQMIPLLVIL